MNIIEIEKCLFFRFHGARESNHEDNISFAGDEILNMLLL